MIEAIRSHGPLVTVVLMVTALLPGLVAPAQAADATTCNGRPATVVLTGGGPGASYTAPDATDAVIVVLGGTYSFVNGNAGNDAICLVGEAKVGSVSGAGGNDVVDTSALSSHPHLSGLIGDGRPLDVIVYLDGGRDTVIGGPAWEAVRSTAGQHRVSTGEGSDSVLARTSEVTVSAGPGDDEVRVEDAAARVDLGDGDDQAYSDDTSSVGVEGGPGVDRLYLDAPQDELHNALVDLEAGFFAVDGRTANSLVGIEDLTTAGFEDLRVRGSDEPNDVVVQGCRATVGAAGGADSVLVSLERCASKSKRVKPGFQAVSFAVRGGPGADRVEADTRGRDVFNGGPGSDVVIGGGSNDVLKGGSGSDRIVGQGGIDTGQGGNGHDTCKTERRTSC